MITSLLFFTLVTANLITTYLTFQRSLESRLMRVRRVSLILTSKYPFQTRWEV